MRKTLIIFLLLLSGCASLNQSVPYVNNGLDSVHLRVEYVGKSKTNNTHLPKLVYVEFPLIPGGISGRILTDQKFSSFAEVGDKITIDLSSIGSSIALYATPLLSTPYNTGIKVTPAEAKLVRVGTFAYSGTDGRIIGSTGISAEGLPENNGLMLVYFDRPTRLTGTAEYEGVVVQHEVNVKGAGFVWLISEEISQTEYKISVWDSTEQEVLEIEEISKQGFNA